MWSVVESSGKASAGARAKAKKKKMGWLLSTLMAPAGLNNVKSMFWGQQSSCGRRYLSDCTVLSLSSRVPWWCEPSNQGEGGSSGSRAHPLWRLGEEGPLCRLLVHYPRSVTFSTVDSSRLKDLTQSVFLTVIVFVTKRNCTFWTGQLSKSQKFYSSISLMELLLLRLCSIKTTCEAPRCVCTLMLFYCGWVWEKIGSTGSASSLCSVPKNECEDE